MKIVTLTVFFGGLLAVTALGGNEEKFLKKYAMMKIYESCFGPEVVKQIRKELKAACAKCALTVIPQASPETVLDHANTKEENSKNGPSNKDVPNDNENSVNQLHFDPEKLHQAILSYRPNPFQPTFRPFGPNNGFYPGYVNQGPVFFPTNPGFHGNPMQFTPAYPQFPPFLPPAFFGSQRTSRDMNMKDQFEALTARMNSRVRNVTCVMQELGYLDNNLEPNYENIQGKIDSLPIPAELKQDIQEGVTFCQQFSQCIPLVKKDRSPLSSELMRPMFFFRCYKHKKLEACVMKDIRDRFAGEAEENLDNLNEPDMEVRRTGKVDNLDGTAVDEVASSVYEFLYGTETMNFESLL